MTMSDAGKSEDLGRMSPAQVVRCAEGSNTVCWIRAEVTADDGMTTSYECCGGGGQKASFTARTGFLSPKTVSPADVPDDLSWSRRCV
jgi:hypothetical protein